MKKQHIKLSTIDREYLEKLVTKGELAVRMYRRALGLLELDRGKSASGIFHGSGSTGLRVPGQMRIQLR